jgi:TonB family protein
MLALILSHAIAAANTPAYLASCPVVPGHIIQNAVWIAPSDVHATNRRARFFVDVGSDGRIRRVALVESSGDTNFDTAAQAAIRTEKFAAPEQNCIATSTTNPQSFDVPLMSLVTPPPAGSSNAPTIPTPPPPAAVAICGAPFGQITSIDVPMKKAPPGTVGIDVGLNAAAKVTSVQLASSSGNKALDYLATTSARTASYQLITAPGCAPKPIVYRLELTYR